MMELCTVPLVDTVVHQGLELGADLDAFDTNCLFLDIPDSVECETIPIMGNSVHDVVLDSDVEETEVVDSAASFKEQKKTSDRWKLNTLVYRRRQRKNVGECSIQSLASAVRTTAKEGANKHGLASFPPSDSGISKEKLHDPYKIVDKDNGSVGCRGKMIKRNLFEDVVDAQMYTSSHCEAKRGKKDLPTPTCHLKLEIVGDNDSLDDGEHIDALDFVDHFLSVNNQNISEKIGSRKVELMKSPPTFNAKGVRTLAWRANLVSKARDSAIFNWDGSETTETHIPDAFDVGYDTQMAAEAMEALTYAPPPNLRAESKELKICDNLRIAGTVSQDKRNQLDNVVIASTDFNGGISFPVKANSQDPICKEPLATKSLICEKPLSVKKNFCGRNCQHEEDGNSEREVLKGVGGNLYSSPFKERKHHGNDTIVKKFRSSNATKKNKDNSSERSTEISKDVVIRGSKRSKSTKLEFSVPEKRRQTNNVDLRICKVLKRKTLNSSFDAFSEIRRSKRTKRGRSNSSLLGPGISLKLEPWGHTKQKRTYKGVPRNSKGSKPLRWMGEPLSLRQAECHSFPERAPSAEVSKQKVKGKISTKSEKMLSMDPDRVELPYQSEKSDIMAPVENIKGLQTDKSKKERKVPGKKILSSSSLTKELTRLGYTKSLPDYIPRELRRRRKENVSVLFSQHLESKILNQQKKIVARLGFSVATCCSDATHFVTDRFVRTRNMLEAIARGKPVVAHSWLESCGRANCFVDEKCHILRDAKKEEEIGFSMHISLARAAWHPLLMGRRVLITPNVKPGIELIQILVKAVHGKAVKRIPELGHKDGLVPTDLLILSTEDDYDFCVPLLEKGAAIYDSELLLNGIVIQKLELQRHQLFADYVGSN